MSENLFFILAGIVLLGIVLAGLLRKPAPPPPPPKDDFHRWSVFRIHLARLLEEGGTIAEAFPGGPVLISRGAVRPQRPDLRLLSPDRKERIRISARRRFRRHRAWIHLDGELLAELRGGKDGAVLTDIRSQSLDFTVQGSPEAMELEARREGKLLALTSSEIARSPGSVGIEILATADPLPVLAVMTAIGLLRMLYGPPAPAEKAPPAAVPGAAASSAAGPGPG